MTFPCDLKICTSSCRSLINSLIFPALGVRRMLFILLYTNLLKRIASRTMSIPVIVAIEYNVLLSCTYFQPMVSVTKERMTRPI